MKKPHFYQYALLAFCFPTACAPVGPSALGPVASVPASSSTIPAAFHGTWTIQRSGVHPPGEDPTRITANRIYSHETVGLVKTVQVLNPQDITVTLKCNGEGEEWETVQRYNLTADGILIVDSGQPLYRVR
jgi:hypothetical protein